MKILALEFSSPLRSVAVALGAPSLIPQEERAGLPSIGSAKEGERRLLLTTHVVSCSEVVETGGRAAKALGAIEEALRQAQLEREQIECVAIGLGPGSYNGIRAAIALAQGWQLARAIKLVGVSSAQCVAAQAQAEGLAGRVAVVIDAQRGEFYLGSYEIGAQDCSEVHPLRLAAMSQVQECQKSGQQIIGPEATKWFPGSHVVFPRAATLARLALGRSDFVSGEKLEPIYLRATNFVKAPPPRILPS
jgi:tRNA threonylcarbamoyl adenosine modification protein YeaZ